MSAKGLGFVLWVYQGGIGVYGGVTVIPQVIKTIDGLLAHGLLAKDNEWEWHHTGITVDITGKQTQRTRKYLS